MQNRLWRSALQNRSLPRIEELEGRLLLANYFVHPLGSDSNPGTGRRPTQAWQTIGKVNGANLNAGDSVFFFAGATFTGNLFLNALDTASPTNPLTITSYGPGRATISSGNSAAIFASTVEGINITNLIMVGSGMFNNSSTGVHFLNPKTDGTMLRHFHVNNVEVSGYGSTGMLFESAYGNGYMQDIRVTNSVFHHNLNGGIQTIGPGGASTGVFYRTIFDVYIAYVTIYDNAGVTLGGVDGALVERSVSYNTTDFGSLVGGGFVVYNSSNVVLQHNEAYNVKSPGIEGAGFALDWDTVNCVLQYNYSHDNDGAGFVLFGSPGFGLPDSFGNTIRFNVSENDARVNTYAGITVYLGVYNAEIYNNTVFMEPRPGVAYSAFQLWEWSGASLHIRNNIFSTTGGVPLVVVFTPTGSGFDLVFQGNNYYSSGAPFTIYYEDAPYSSLAAWRVATNQEKLNNTPTGSSVDPQLKNPGNGGTIGNPDLLETMTAYQLKPTSPLKNSGLNLLALFGLDPGPEDFFGNPFPHGAEYSVGAHDLA